MVVTGIVKQYTADMINNNPIIINNFIKLGISYSEKDPYFISHGRNPRTYPDFIFQIEDKEGEKEIQVGRSDIYELTQPVYIQEIKFPNGYPNSIKIDIVYCDGEEEE